MANRKKSIPADITEAAAVTTEAAPTAETVTAQPAETAAEITAAAAEEKPAAKRGRRPAAKKENTENAEKKPAARRGRKPAAAKTENAEAAAEKKPAAKRGRKPAAAKTEAAEAAAEKKPAAKRGRKPAAAKTETAKPAAKRGRKPAAAKAEIAKPAAKRGRRPAAAKTEKAAETTAKRGASRKGISYESVVDAAKKKILAANITKIKYPVSANIELSGSVTGDFYIYIDADNQTIAVEPYKYNNHDVSFRADADELLAVLKGKKNIYDALSEGNIKVSGITTKAILLIDAAF